MTVRWLRKPRVVTLTLWLVTLSFVIACGAAATATPEPPATNPPAEPTATTAPGSAQATATPVAQPSPTIGEPASEPEYGGIIPVHNSGNIAHWSIWECGSGGTCMAPTSPLYNGLVQYDGTTPDPNDIRGDLAQDWEVSNGGQTYTFHLHENARWWDGEPVTAEDIVFSLDQMVRPDAPRPRAGQIRLYYESSRVIDPQTVEVTLRFPAPAFLPYLATEFMKMLPKHHVEPGLAQEQDFMRKQENILGSGPFKLSSYQRDVVIEYEKNPDYFKEGLPYFEGMRYFIINEPSRIIASYKAQQVLMTSFMNSNLTIRQATELQQDMEGKGTVYFSGPVAWVGLLINTDKEPFTDPKVRQAIQLVLHRQEFVNTFGGGRNPIGGPFPPGQPWSYSEEELLQMPGFRQTPDGEKHPDDIARAQELLDEAGYPDGFETTILAAQFLSFPDMAQVAANQLKRWLNIDAVVQPAEPAAGYVRYEGGDWELGFHGNGFLVMDPDAVIQGSYLEAATRNYSGWEPPRITELATSIASEPDAQMRREVALEMSDYLINQDNHVAITHWTTLHPYVDNRIKNFHLPSVFPAHTMKEHLWFEE